MYRIETAPLTYPPYQCMVTGRDDGELIVFDADILPHLEGEPPRMTVKADIIEEIARDLGMVSKAQVDEIREQVEEWGAQVTAALDQLAVTSEFEEKFALTPTPPEEF